MPTENRSSNTEMVSVPPYIGREPLVGRYYPAQCRRCGWVGSSEELTEDDAQCTRDIGDRLCLGDCDELERHDLLSIIQAMAAPQPHPEPIAWMVGTAFWWTKEEAERDAAATGLPVVPVGPMVDTAEVERLRTENIRLIEDRARFPDRPDDIGIMIGCHIGNLKNQAKSSEDYAKKWRWKLEAAQRNLSERDALLREGSSMMPLGTKKRADWVLAAEAALSTSAEPETRS
ncbi:hypothetical protein [Pseudomonas asiatica]|uniref:hypothetical protein n=1 Tax=Pseudomonas asiatica TaxID=2219225 RepID=UPI003B9404A2